MGKHRVFLLSIILLIFFLCNNSLAQPKWLKAKDVVYYLYKNDKLEWSFKAKTLVQVGPNEFKAKDIIIKNEIQKITITGKLAFFNKLKDVLVVKGNAVLKAPKVGTILTNELEFFLKEGLVTSKGEVLVKKEGMTIKGKGMIYKIKTGEFKLKEKARIKFEL